LTYGPHDKRKHFSSKDTGRGAAQIRLTHYRNNLPQAKAKKHPCPKAEMREIRMSGLMSGIWKRALKRHTIIA
jgi:hypothetical protein